MTVGVAAIYGRSNSPGVVVIADRMISMGPMTFEHSVSKLKIIIDDQDIKVVGVAAGDLSLINDFFDKLVQDASACKSVREVALKGVDVYNSMLRDSIKRRLLDPFGLDFATLQGGNLPTELVQRFITDSNNLVQSYYDNLQVLLAGVDGAGGHIMYVLQSDYSLIDSLGFGAVGSGSSSATWVLVHKRYNPSESVVYAVALASWAKFQAEEAFGVGTDTDAIIVAKDGLQHVRKEVLDNIRNEVTKIQDEEDRELATLISNLKLGN